MCRNYGHNGKLNMRLARETQPHICFYCKRPLSEEEITIDHVQPMSRGGQTTEDNLVIACHHCNQEKAELTLQEYINFLDIKKSIILKFETLINDLMQELNRFNNDIVDKNYKYLKKHDVATIMSNQFAIINLLKNQRDILIENEYQDYIADIRYQLEVEARKDNEVYGVKQLKYPNETQEIKYIHHIINNRELKKKQIDVDKFNKERQYFINNNAISKPIVLDQHSRINDIDSYIRYLILKESRATLAPIIVKSKKRTNNNITTNIIGNNNQVNINL